MLGSEDNIQELVLTFYYVGSWDWAQAVRLDGKYLYPLRHIAGPDEQFLS